MHLGLIALAIHGVALTTPLSAHAERVAVVRPDPSDPVLMDAFNRLKAELGIHQFDAVVVIRTLADAPGEALAEIARHSGALASIAFVQHGSKASVDVWLVDRLSGKTSMRRLEVGQTADAPSVLAIRAVDLLRASLLELDSGKRPPPDVVGVDPGPVPEAARALASPPMPQYALRVEGMALFYGTELGLAYGPAVGVHRGLGRFELGVVLAGPLIGTEFRAQRGSASTIQALGWVEGRVSAWRSRVFEIGLGLGFGAHGLWARGQAEPPLISRSDSVWGVLGSVGAHARLNLSQAAALGFGLRALGVMPKPGVALATEQVVPEQPFLSASAGIVVDL